jgi:hypothetical protein
MVVVVLQLPPPDLQNFWKDPVLTTFTKYLQGAHFKSSTTEQQECLDVSVPAAVSILPPYRMKMLSPIAVADALYIAGGMSERLPPCSSRRVPPISTRDQQVHLHTMLPSKSPPVAGMQLLGCC